MKKTSLLLLAAWIFLCSPTAPAEEESNTAKLQAAKQSLTGQEYDLRYRFHAGETIRYKVVHLVTIETTIKGTKQEVKTRSISTKAWKVQQPEEEGRITFVHMVENVDMSQQVTGRKAVRYNSKTDKEPPQQYQHVAQSLDVPLTTITIDAHGKIIQRKDARKQLGMGGRIVMPLPGRPVKIGARWFDPLLVKVKLKDGRVKQVKTRQQYRLEKVTDGIATISVHSQLLTPVDDPKVKIHLVQRLTHGTIQFDIEAGRVISQKLDLNERVIAFNGPESMMQYVGQFREELLPTPLGPVAASPQSPKPAASPKESPAGNTANQSATTKSKPIPRLGKVRKGKPKFRRR